MADPKRWSAVQLTKQTDEAVRLFRAGRVGEPQIYSKFFEAFAPIFRDLIDNSLPKLLKDASDGRLVASIVSDEDARTAF